MSADLASRQRAGDLVIAAAREHYRARVSAEGLRRIEVAEWEADGRPLVIYFRPVLTMYQRHRIDSKIGEGRIPTIVEGLIVRALDSEGRALFAEADRHALMNHADADVLMKIAEEIVAGSVAEPSAEALEENSEAAAR
jgi:hypothetical protein